MQYTLCMKSVISKQMKILNYDFKSYKLLNKTCIKPLINNFINSKVCV